MDLFVEPFPRGQPPDPTDPFNQLGPFGPPTSPLPAIAPFWADILSVDLHVRIFKEGDGRERLGKSEAIVIDKNPGFKATSAVVATWFQPSGEVPDLVSRQ